MIGGRSHRQNKIETGHQATSINTTAKNPDLPLRVASRAAQTAETTTMTKHKTTKAGGPLRDIDGVTNDAPEVKNQMRNAFIEGSTVV